MFLLIFLQIILFFLSFSEAKLNKGEKDKWNLAKLSLEKYEELIESINSESKLGRAGSIVEEILKFKFDRLSKSRLNLCYDGRILGKVVNIFKEPIGVIVKKFFQFHENLRIRPQDEEEVKERVRIVLSNVRFVAKRVIQCMVNSDPDFRPSKLGLTRFTAYSQEEFTRDYQTYESKIWESSAMLGSKPRPCKPVVNKAELSKIIIFDWRDEDAVTSVRNQQECNSCFIYSAVGAMESSYFIHELRKTKEKIQQFSEQPFLSCLNNSCKGGTIPSVWDLAKKVGVTLLEDNPNHGYPGNCTYSYPVSKPIDYCMTHPIRNDLELQSLVYAYGPITVAVNADDQDFRQLKDSPYNFPCGSKPTHALLLVGWTRKYWILKNSWGMDWGIDGYLKLPKTNQNQCGIYFEAGVPFFKTPKEADDRVTEVPTEKPTTTKAPTSTPPTSVQLITVTPIDSDVLAYLNEPQIIKDISDDVNSYSPVRYTKLDIVAINRNDDDTVKQIWMLADLVSTDSAHPLRAPYNHTLEIWVSVYNGEPRFKGFAIRDLEMELNGRWPNQVHDEPVVVN